jgi:hypothetical protein
MFSEKIVARVPFPPKTLRVWLVLAALKLPSASTLTVMMLSPADRGVMFPDASTVATLGLELE